MLLSVDDARRRLLEAFAPLPVELIPTAKAVGRVLAVDLCAPFDYPPFSNSSMDGFAVRACDLEAATVENPVTLKVMGDVPAGAQPSLRLSPMEALRIMTGAVVPDGADAVVPVEDTDFNVRDAGVHPPDYIKVVKHFNVGDFIRPKGQDFHRNDTLVRKGRIFSPRELGLAAMLGYSDVNVYRKPKIAVLPSGDELITPGEDLVSGKIYESNGYTLSAMIEKAGGEAFHLGIAGDDAASVQKRLDEALSLGVDLILSSAGVSVGAFDFVRKVVETHGKLGFWRVNMRPGKPLVFGHYKDIPFIGLPGNPVSSYVGFEVFVKFAIMKMLGVPDWKPEKRIGYLAEPIDSDGRETYLRGIATYNNSGQWITELTGHQGSGNHYSLVGANVLICMPAGVKYLPENAEVELWVL